MGNCVKLKWNRKRLGLTQKEFAKKVGLSPTTIAKLEVDESAWATIRSSTVDKITDLYSSMASWQPSEEEAERVLREIKDTVVEPEVEETKKVEPEVFVVQPVHISNNLTDMDKHMLALIGNIYGWLEKAKDHDDFVAHIELLKKIIE